MKLIVGKRYRLHSEDVIEVLEECASNTVEATERGFKTVMFDGSHETIAKCRLVEKNRTYGYELLAIQPAFTHDKWPGKNEGDILEYLSEGGLCSGWDHRAFPLHVKEQVAD